MSNNNNSNNEKLNNEVSNNEASHKNIDLTQEITIPTDPLAKKTDIQNPELWSFPMDYPMSIIGHEGEHDTLLNEVKIILGTHFPDFDHQAIQVRKSSTGRFSSLRVKLYFTEAEQVNNLYEALDKASTVRTVV